MSNTIGLVVPDVPGIAQSVYYNTLIAGASHALGVADYRLKTILLKPDADLRSLYDFRSSDAVQGLIMTQWFRFFSSPSIFERMDIPCVHINDFEENVGVHFVCEDGAMGGRLVAEHLYAKGHRRVGVITGAAWSRDSKMRVEGFRACWQEKGEELPQERIIAGDFDEEPITNNAVDRLIEQNVMAIFSCNDTMAFMIIRHLAGKGIRCPEDISVVGYDDDARGATFSPPLTTVRVPVYGLAERAAGILLFHIEQKKTGLIQGNTRVPMTLIERGSVRAV